MDILARVNVPLNVPYLAGNEKEYLTRCVRDNWVSSVGPYVTKFENDFADYVDADHAVACSSGTAALHLALLSVGVGPGDLVLVSTLTFIASANAIRYVGAEPVLVDCSADTWQIDPRLVAEFLDNQCEISGEKCIHGATKRRVAAILPVHILGHAVDIDRILKLAQQYRLKVVEDAAEGIGTYVGDTHVGCFGDAGCFSFNGNKTITTGCGGMVVSNDEDVALRVKFLSQQAKESGREFVHQELGYNYRMSNLHAAVGLAQLEQLPQHLAKKLQISERYREELIDVPGISWNVVEENTTSAWWLCTVRISEREFGASATMLQDKLLENGIETRKLWQPMHLSAVHRDSFCVGGQCAEELFKEALSLPSSVSLTQEDQDRVISIIRGVCNSGVIL